MFTIGNAKCIECINQTRERHFVATDERRKKKSSAHLVASRIFLAFINFAIFFRFRDFRELRELLLGSLVVHARAEFEADSHEE